MFDYSVVINRSRCLLLLVFKSSHLIAVIDYVPDSTDYAACLHGCYGDGRTVFSFFYRRDYFVIQ